MKKEILLTPGPTQVPPEILAACAKPIIHHRTQEFRELFVKLHEGLKYILQTDNDVFILASSGTGAMETCVVNTLSAGDKVIVGNTGKFGERFAEICKVYGVQVIEITKKWGEIIDSQEIEQILNKEKNIKAVFITHSETSSGVVNDIESVGNLLKTLQTLLIVDSVSALGGAELKMDEWGIDVVAAGSQKALMLPPGLAFVSISQKGWKSYERSTLPKFYFDIKKYKTAYEKDKESPFTIPVSLCMGLAKAIEMIQNEGLENVFARHKKLAAATRAGINALGLELFSKSLSPVETVLTIPKDIDGKKLITLMREKYGVRVAGGQGGYSGKILRIAHMGWVTNHEIILAVSALEMALKEFNWKFIMGNGIKAVEEALRER